MSTPACTSPLLSSDESYELIDTSMSPIADAEMENKRGPEEEELESMLAEMGMSGTPICHVNKIKRFIYDQVERQRTKWMKMGAEKYRRELKQEKNDRIDVKKVDDATIKRLREQLEMAETKNTKLENQKKSLRKKLAAEIQQKHQMELAQESTKHAYEAKLAEQKLSFQIQIAYRDGQICYYQMKGLIQQTKDQQVAEPPFEISDYRFDNSTEMSGAPPVPFAFRTLLLKRENGLFGFMLDGAFTEGIKKGGPADRAGLEVADRIIAIDGVFVINALNDEISQKIKMAGDEIKLIVSYNPEFFKFDKNDNARRLVPL